MTPIEYGVSRSRSRSQWHSSLMGHTCFTNSSCFISVSSVTHLCNCWLLKLETTKTSYGRVQYLNWTSSFGKVGMKKEYASQWLENSFPFRLLLLTLIQLEPKVISLLANNIEPGQPSHPWPSLVLILISLKLIMDNSKIYHLWNSAGHSYRLLL